MDRTLGTWEIYERKLRERCRKISDLHRCWDMLGFVFGICSYYETLSGLYLDEAGNDRRV